MQAFEVIARYAHGSRAVVVQAADAEAAIRKARPTLRRMLGAYQITSIWATLAY